MTVKKLNDFEKALSGGHPNSLGNTMEVVDDVFKDVKRVQELFDCYHSKDEVVRLRVSNAFKRIFRERPELFKPMVQQFFTKIPKLRQPSAEWTLAQLCYECEEQLSKSQKEAAKEMIKNFLSRTDDWIVLNVCIQSLGTWAEEDANLRSWLLPKLEKLSNDSRKTVSKRAYKFYSSLSGKNCLQSK